MHLILHWLTVHTGSQNMPGVAPNYNFWSGFGSDIGEVAIIGGLVGLYRKHTCHQDRCWRISRHVVNGTPWCNRHHENARLVQAAAADSAPPFASIEGKLDKLSDDVSGLAEAVRAVVAPKGTRL